MYFYALDKSASRNVRSALLRQQPFLDRLDLQADVARVLPAPGEAAADEPQPRLCRVRLYIGDADAVVGVHVARGSLRFNADFFRDVGDQFGLRDEILDRRLRRVIHHFVTQLVHALDHVGVQQRL